MFVNSFRENDTLLIIILLVCDIVHLQFDRIIDVQQKATLWCKWKSIFDSFARYRISKVNWKKTKGLISGHPPLPNDCSEQLIHTTSEHSNNKNENKNENLIMTGL